MWWTRRTETPPCLSRFPSLSKSETGYKRTVEKNVNHDHWNTARQQLSRAASQKLVTPGGYAYTTTFFFYRNQKILSFWVSCLSYSKTAESIPQQSICTSILFVVAVAGFLLCVGGLLAFCLVGSVFDIEFVPVNCFAHGFVDSVVDRFCSFHEGLTFLS